MVSKSKKTANKNKLWLITNGRPSETIPNDFNGLKISGSFREYLISDFARYLLYPGPITIEDRLVGANIRQRKPAARALADYFLKRFKMTDTDETDELHEYIMADTTSERMEFNDNELNIHFNKITSLLRPYNPLIKHLARLEPGKISDITGICEDIAGNRYRLDLHGDVKDKMSYILAHLSSNVKITLKRAHISEGLFELRAFDFKSFVPSSSSRLLSFQSNGDHTYAVAGTHEKPGFIVEDPRVVSYLHLLEQSIITNPELSHSLDLCLNGDAEPFKLYFSNRLEFAYSNNHLPRIFRKEFDVNNMGSDEKERLATILNSQQNVVSFNYVPTSSSGDDKMFTNISVMHDFRALEPIRKNLPRLYSEINERVHISEAGALYLLDAIGGTRNG